MATSDDPGRIKTALTQFLRTYPGDDVSKGMLLAACDCLSRTPLTRPQTVFDLIESLRQMTEHQIDFSLLLKAGVMLGLSDSYSRFKKRKRKYFRSKMIAQKLKKILVPLQEHGFQCELNTSANPPELRICGGKSFANDEERVQYIKEILKLDENQWKIVPVGLMNEDDLLLLPRTKFETRIVKDDLNVSRTGLGSSYAINSEKYEGHENLVFYAIYQDNLFDPAFYRIQDELHNYFCLKEGRYPDDNELEKLRMKYYRCIRKAYPQDITIVRPSVDNPYPPRFMREPTIQMGEHPNVFYLKRRPYAVDRRIQAGTYSAPTGKMVYDVKTKSYWLMPGTRVVIPDKEPAEYGTLEILYKEAENNARIVVQEVSSGFFTKESPRDGVQEKKTVPKIKVAFVCKKIKVKSATLAAQLVLGYKRSGLDYWRNNKGKSLREYLKSIGHLDEHKISSKSKNAVNYV